VRRAIVNVAVEQGFYTALQRSVKAACEAFCGEADLFFTGYPDRCPKHADQNYAFKVWAIDAVVQQGYRQILWIDCRCRPVRAFDPVWQCIERTGYYLGQQGDSVLGDWTSDAALEIFGINRETARTIPLLRGGVVGLNLDTEVGTGIWEIYKAMCAAGALNGAHLNTPGLGWGDWGGGKWKGHVSSDPAVGGHRHDESVLSFAVWKLGLSPSLDLTNIDTPESSLIARNL
jgi:hypothetical protein